jgi:glycine dehydrogenase subunit 1
MPVHPYIPNSEPDVKREMLRALGVKNADDLFEIIPEKIRFRRRLNLPSSTPESEVKRHVEQLLAKNASSSEMTVFSGAGCWPHYVPAVCDEINSRSEFLTAYTGDVYSDLGRYQALFEFQSMIGELVAMDAVTFPTYDWPTAAGDAVRMAALITGRREIFVPRTMSPDRLSVMNNFCGSLARIRHVDYDRLTGEMDLEALKSKMTNDTAAVYVENPSYLGFIETRCSDIAQIAHDEGALFMVGVDPLSLGILAPPGEYGADIVCGEGQPLGVHMNYGGASLGFLACRDDARYLSATGHRLISITKTKREGEWGFTYVLPERSMFAARDKAPSITGTGTILWAITAAVYLSLLGPKGLRELAETIIKNAHYAMKRLSEIEGVRTPLFSSPHFKEYTVNFDKAMKPAHEVNKALARFGIQGGKDISTEFPELGSTSLYCTTELHTMEDIDRLGSALEEVVKQ